MEMAKPSNNVVEKPRRLGIRVDYDTYDALTRLADSEKRSISEIVRFAIADYLGNHSNQN